MEKKSKKITLGDLVENKVDTIEDFEKLLDKKNILDPEDRKKNIETHNKFIQETQHIFETIPIKSIIPDSIFKNFADAFRGIDQFFISLKPFLNVFTNFVNQISPSIIEFIDSLPNKTISIINKRCKKIQKIYSYRLRKGYNLFRVNIILFKDKPKLILIIFIEFFMLCAAILENYLKKIISVYKNEYEWIQLREKKVYRKELIKDLKDYTTIEFVQFKKIFVYINNIVDSIKHKDYKFYKRYENKAIKFYLDEAEILYYKLREYFEEFTDSFLIFEVLKNY